MRKLLIIIMISLFLLPIPSVAGIFPKVFRNGIKKGSTLVNGSAIESVLQRSSSVRSIQISNFPGTPMMQFRLGKSIPIQGLPTAKLVSSEEASSLIFLESDPGKQFKRKRFVPNGLLGSQQALYRGMSLEIGELKNLLVNGLETKKTFVNTKIFTSIDPDLALIHALPSPMRNEFYNKKADLPVLIKIPYMPLLNEYGADSFDSPYWGVIAFLGDIPAKLISDIWVFLEVNGRPDWYKAVLEDGEMVLLPANGTACDTSEEINKW